MKKKLILLSILGLFNHVGYGGDLWTLPKAYKVRGYLNYGEIDGFVQIPKGGQFGTTTVERPTFDELGINNITFPELRLQAEWDKLITYMEFRYKVFDGNGRLEKDLTSHSKFIPAGSSMYTKHKYISYNLGVGYNISKFDRFTLIPVAEFSANDFEYRYSATTPEDRNISSKRSFGWGQLNFGLNSSYQFTDKYSLEFNMKSGIEHDSVRKYYNLELVNNYEIYKDLHILVGVEHEKVHFRDTQRDMQNFMKHNNLLYKVGLEYVF